MTALLQRTLDRGWSLRAAGGSPAVPAGVRGRTVAAAVPGCVHTDLLEAGLIPDPYHGRNELELQWIGETDWEYACRFEIPSEMLERERLDLVCEGLDTVAALDFNGTAIGETANMHRSYRFDLRGRVAAGENRLRIRFRAPRTAAIAVRDALGDLPNAYRDAPFNFIRKMACSFGWDWGPVLTSTGVWKPVRLEAWDGARLAAVRPQVRLRPDGDAELRIDLEIDRQSGERQDLLLEAALARSDIGEGVVEEGAFRLAPDGRRQEVVLTVRRPQLWWPRGYGGQPLYPLDLALRAGSPSSPVLDRQRFRIGFRTVELDTSPDEVGSAFTLRINGRPVLCKGANWIPDDCFPTRVDEARYRRRLEQAAGAGMNMLRVWGGGIYETGTFYDLCDDMGLLVWQDFLFACAAYPEEEPFRSEVEAEAREQVTRLCCHPSLVLWNGNNETLWGHVDWGWRERLGERTWGRGYYLELLPAIVGDLDPGRPYWPGSPYSGRPEIHPNDDRYGTAHLWDAWNEKDYTVYRDHAPRFAGEFGYQGPPGYATLREALGEVPSSFDSPALLHRQRASDGPAKLTARTLEHFPEPRSLGAWLYATQLNQARAVAFAVEHLRSLQPRCMGFLYWQLNDCWPVISWSAIDGYGRPKPLWYATRRFFADRLLTIQPREGKLVLFACNDSDQAWRGTATVTRGDFLGGRAALLQADVAVPPRAVAPVLVLPGEVAEPDDASREFLIAEASGLRATWFFRRDRELAYPARQMEARLIDVAAGGRSRQRLELTGRTLLRDVVLYVDRLQPDATADEQLVTLLPGETFAFEIDADTPLALEDLIAPEVLWSADQLVRGSRSRSGGASKNR